MPSRNLRVNADHSIDSIGRSKPSTGINASAYRRCHPRVTTGGGREACISNGHAAGGSGEGSFRCSDDGVDAAGEHPNGQVGLLHVPRDHVHAGLALGPLEHL
jgi:hypothetical protein